MTTWNYVTEFMDDEDEKIAYYKMIITAFLSSKNVSETNKNNLISLVNKLNNIKIKENYIEKIRNKMVCQKNTTLE